MKKIERKHIKRAAIGFGIWAFFSLLVSDFQFKTMAAMLVAGLFGVLYYFMAAAGLNPFITGMKSMWSGGSWMEEYKEKKDDEPQNPV